MNIKISESGQGCVEYVLIMFISSLCAISVVAFLIDKYTSIPWWQAAIVLGIIAILNILLFIRSKLKGVGEKS